MKVQIVIPDSAYLRALEKGWLAEYDEDITGKGTIGIVGDWTGTPWAEDFQRAAPYLGDFQIKRID